MNMTNAPVVLDAGRRVIQTVTMNVIMTVMMNVQVQRANEKNRVKINLRMLVMMLVQPSEVYQVKAD